MDAVRHKHSDVVAFLKRNGAVLHHDKAKGRLYGKGLSSGPPIMSTALTPCPYWLYVNRLAQFQMDGCIDAWMHERMGA